MSDQTKPRRRRGAPRGNTNALKHGLYTHRRSALDFVPLEEITEQIVMLRAFTRRTFELGYNLQNFKESAALLRIICIATGRIALLMSAQNRLMKAQSTQTPPISPDFRELLQSLGIPLTPEEISALESALETQDALP